MDELLQKLLEAEILSAETKTELEQAFADQLNEAVESAKEEARETIRVELTEQWVGEREKLIEALDTKVNEFLDDEFTEIKEELNRFRDLEVEHAEKLVEAEEKMAQELESNLEQLVETLDQFLEVRLTAEIDELKEDIEDARKLQFGKEVFEAFVQEYRNNFVDEDNVESELKETQQQLKLVQEDLKKANKQIEDKLRGEKIKDLLKPLAGHKRDVMEAILTNLPTTELERGYETFLGRVLKEEEVESTAKEDEVLSEGSTQAKDDQTEELSEGVIVSGDTEEVDQKDLTEEDESKTLNEDFKASLRRLGGIVN